MTDNDACNVHRACMAWWVIKRHQARVQNMYGVIKHIHMEILMKVFRAFVRIKIMQSYQFKLRLCGFI